MALKPNVKLGEIVLRKRSDSEPDTWVQCEVNQTYLKLINEFPDDYRQLDGSNLEMQVFFDNEDVAQIIVEKLGMYVNDLDRRDLGVPLQDNLAVKQMQYIVIQILTDPYKEVKMPDYD